MKKSKTNITRKLSRPVMLTAPTDVSLKQSQANQVEREWYNQRTEEQRGRIEQFFNFTVDSAL